MKILLALAMIIALTCAAIAAGVYEEELQSDAAAIEDRGTDPLQPDPLQPDPLQLDPLQSDPLRPEIEAAGGLEADWNDTALIPRETLMGNPDKTRILISSDGKWIGYMAPLNGVLNVWVAPTDNVSDARPVTNDTYRGIHYYTVAYTNRHVIYTQDTDGDENWKVYVVDLITDERKNLTPLEGVNAVMYHVGHRFPQEILVGLNDRDPQHHDVYIINITTGERRLIQKNENFTAFALDENYAIRLGIRTTPDGGEEIYEHLENGSWKLFMDVDRDDQMTTGPVRFDKAGTTLYMVDSRGRDTSALVSFNMTTGEEEVIFEDARSDVGGTMAHPTERTPQAVAYTYDRMHWKVLDPSIEEDMEYLATVEDADFSPYHKTLDDRQWVVAYYRDDGPVKYYLYNRDSKEARFLFSDREELESLPLAKMHPAVINASDGLGLVCYYTLPVWSDEDGDGIPTEPLPMVLNVHGGPWGRDTWGLDSEHQLLANRGYAVLSVNFRGSTGLGKSFVNAGDHEWAGKMHTDLLDAVNWTVEQGIADPEKVAIWGGSYGGYAALVGMTFTPETFACGVDICGLSNLITSLESFPPYWQPEIDIWRQRVGDNRTEEGRAFLRSRSPLTYADRIRRPLLIAQGENDPRVVKNESDQIVQAMRSNEIPVTYMVYHDEGHGFARPENRLSFYAVAEAFLAEHLGGRYEPVGEAFNGSNFTVQEGAAGVPGLIEALDERPE